MTQDPWAKKRSLYAPQSPKLQKPAPKKWRVAGFMWRGLKRFCMLLGAGVLITSMISLWTLSSILGPIEQPTISLPNQMVLYMNLDGQLSDLPKEIDFLDPFAPQGITMRAFIDALDRAKTDSRVKGIYARLEQGGYSIAHLQEMRAAIKRFRASGKFAYIYSSSYAETGGLGSYYLASAFEEIWMQPMGAVSIAGINAEMPFLRGVLDKIGVEPQFFQRKEYKSAYENLTHANITPANQEMLESMIGDIAQVMVKDIAQDRKTTPEAFKVLVDQGLFTAPEAKAAKLVDQAQYADLLVEKINEAVTGDKASTDLPYIHFSDYIYATDGQVFEAPKPDIIGPKLPKGEAKGDKPKIALIYAVGAIMDSRETSIKSPAIMMDDGIAAADEIASALLDAADDKSLDAVVLRIDSPGGSPVASETILRAVQKVKDSGKNVTVSMGSTAASGGYWIAAYADQIFVLPSTITGSIGVLGGKVSAQKLWENLGVNWDGVKWGENAGLWSMNTPFSEKEATRMNAMLDNIYVNFVARVAKGRRMTDAQVEAIARGRVWTGAQAIEHRLADQIGGLDAALDFTAQLYGADNRLGADIIIMPKPLTAIEEFIKLLEGQVYAAQVIGTMGTFATQILPNIHEGAHVQIYEPLRVR